MRIHPFVCILISTTSFLISACSPMNSEFSCNATAGDSCLTIEQVDAMTRYADGNNTSSRNFNMSKSGNIK